MLAGAADLAARPGEHRGLLPQREAAVVLVLLRLGSLEAHPQHEGGEALGLQVTRLPGSRQPRGGLLRKPRCALLEGGVQLLQPLWYPVRPPVRSGPVGPEVGVVATQVVIVLPEDPAPVRVSGWWRWWRRGRGIPLLLLLPPQNQALARTTKVLGGRGPLPQAQLARQAELGG